MREVKYTDRHDRAQDTSHKSKSFRGRTCPGIKAQSGAFYRFAHRLDSDRSQHDVGRQSSTTP